METISNPNGAKATDTAGRGEVPAYGRHWIMCNDPILDREGL